MANGQPWWWNDLLNRRLGEQYPIELNFRTSPQPYDLTLMRGAEIQWVMHPSGDVTCTGCAHVIGQVNLDEWTHLSHTCPGMKDDADLYPNYVPCLIPSVPRDFRWRYAEAVSE